MLWCNNRNSSIQKFVTSTGAWVVLVKECQRVIGTLSWCEVLDRMKGTTGQHQSVIHCYTSMLEGKSLDAVKAAYRGEQSLFFSLYSKCENRTPPCNSIHMFSRKTGILYNVLWDLCVIYLYSGKVFAHSQICFTSFCSFVTTKCFTDNIRQRLPEEIEKVFSNLHFIY